MERAAEPARALFGDSGFAALRQVDTIAIRERLGEFTAALDAARDAGQPAVMRMVWDAMKTRRSQRVAEAVAALADDAHSLSTSAPSHNDQAAQERFREYTLADRLQWVERVQTYLHALDELRAAPPMPRTAGARG